MKSTGVIRRMDELGRIVIPMELRRALYLAEGDKMEIYTRKNYVVLKKYAAACVFCGSEKQLESFMEKPICAACKAQLCTKEG